MPCIGRGALYKNLQQDSFRAAGFCMGRGDSEMVLCRHQNSDPGFKLPVPTALICEILPESCRRFCGIFR